ncbi:MAG: CpsB/CapC family capsule biosynthesis tyrosine phosphatase [Mobilitalea sp.]
MWCRLIRGISPNLNTTIINIKMIDLHTHILPNIDDGASSVEEALILTELLYKEDIKIAVCTPHFDPAQTALQEFIRKRATAMALMKASRVKLILGSETVLHEYIFHYTELNELCIGNTRYLLLELPFDNKWDTTVYESLEKLIIHYDLIPIIAHIERYKAVKKNDKGIQKLIKMGCVIQINTSSIIDKQSRDKVIHYMKHGYIDVLGSDCHNIKKRPPIITNALNKITQELGVKYCEELNQNAECIVKGLEIRKKKTYIIE